MKAVIKALVILCFVQIYAINWSLLADETTEGVYYFFRQMVSFYWTTSKMKVIQDFVVLGFWWGVIKQKQWQNLEECGNNIG